MNKSTSRALLLVACAIVAGIGTMAWGIYETSFQNTSIHADAAIVLGAAVWEERPSPVFRERIRHAIALYHDGRVDKIIFTGGQGQHGEPAEAVSGQRYAVAHRVPLIDTWVDTTSRTTRQNLCNARQLAAEHQLASFLLVSDPLHMKRTVAIARDLGMDAYPSPTRSTMYRSAPSQLRFVARETHLYLSYLLRRPLLLRGG